MKKKIGIIICEDGEHWGGEEEKGKFDASRFIDNCNEDNVEINVIHAIGGNLPVEPDCFSFTGFVIGGSRHSVNDNKQWIRRLEAFVRMLYEANVSPKPKIYGICYGHQLIAKALGGEVAQNSSNKFKFGGETVTACDALTEQTFYKNILGDRQTFKVMQAHGEEVRVFPVDAANCGKSSSCSNEILMYGTQIMSTQGHPELIESKMKEVLLPALIRNGKLSEEDVPQVLQSFNGVETDILVRLVISFLIDP